MGEQPGAGKAHSLKIKGHSRQRKVAKPYSRPSDRKKGVLESVRDFFSPSWLLDFWKGNKIAEEDEIEDFDDVNDGEGPTGYNQELTGQFGVNERPGFSSTFGHISAVDRRNELLGNGGTRLMTSVHQRSQTSHDSGLSALLAVRSREPLNKKAFDARTAALTSISECTRSIEKRSSSLMVSADTQEVEISNQVQSPSEPSPILSSSQSKARSSVVFSTSLLAGSSSTPVTSQTSPGLSLLSNERCITSSRSQDNPGPSRLSSETLSSSSGPQSNVGPSILFSERLPTSSRPQPTSIFRGKPEFSLSAFGSILPSKSTSQSQRYSSPYYGGKTIFGGASSQVSKTGKRARISSPGSSETLKPVKRQIRPTPLAGTSGGVASQTAKRILEALEKMSSPLADAKKIPPSPPFASSSSPLSFTSKRGKAPPPPYNKQIGSPRKLQAQFSDPPVQSLSVPRRAVISRIHPATARKPSTQSSTVLTGTSSSTVKPIQSFVPTPLPMSLSPMETSKGGGGGKMKTSKTSTTHYKSLAPDEQEHEVTNPLPVITSAIPFTIPTGSSMPSFALSSTSAKVKDQTALAPSFLKSKSPDISSNNFKFSAPEPRNPSSNKTLSNLSSQQKMQYSFSKPAPVNNSENNTSSPVKSPVLDSLEKFKPAQGSWDCSECFVNNKPDASSCVACTASKPASSAPKSKPLKLIPTTSKPTQLPSNDLFKQFQQPIGLFTSKQEDKDNSLTKDKQKPDLVHAKDTLFKQFAPPSDSWECPSCMLNNKAQDLKCVCCQEQKPGETSSKKTCNIISNQTTSTEGSQICQSSFSVSSSFTGGFKILSENKPQNSPFPFGSVDTKVGNTVTFGTSSSNSSDAPSTAAVSFVFGAPSSSSNSEKTYTFGSATTPTSKNLQPTSTNSGNFSFKLSSSDENTKLVPSFEFGKGSDLKSSVATTTFSFGSSLASTDKVPAFRSSAKKDSNNPTPFIFGGNNLEVKNPTKTAIEKESPKKRNLATQETKKVGSIAQAAAAGLLKIPSSVDVVDLTSDISIKPSQDAAPPNVTLFAGQSIANPATPFSIPKATEAKPPASSAPPSLPFAFGASSVKPQAEPEKVHSSFAFTASTTTSSIPKFGGTTASDIKTSAPTQGFQFVTSFDANAKPAGASIFSTPSAMPGFPNTSANTATTSPFVFKGSIDNTEKFGSKLSTSSSGFVFGQNTGNSIFSFSNSSISKSDSSTTGSSSVPFVFGAESTQKSDGFNFGPSTQQPFAFANTNPPVGVPGAVSEESMDADGNNNSSQPAVTPFGSTLAPATQSAPLLSFTQTPSNAGFSFGNVQTPGSFKFGDSTSTSTLFAGSTTPAFGSSTGNPLQQGSGSGFNFGSPATNSAGSQSGGFTFTGGSTTAFTAGSGITTKRVIRRGIRRTRR